ncbi:hypothetical protein BDF22DRAFT_689138 [Syncephalis plumigaleata]|nr:hypothetical protein BDF22DRAFT_689138 [Syncephalis plumigaleata]
MAEVNPFDASFRRSNEAAAVVAAITATMGNTSGVIAEQTMAHWQPSATATTTATALINTTVDQAQTAVSPKRKRSVSPMQNDGDYSSYKHMNTSYDGEQHDDDDDDDDEDDENKRQKFLERNRVAAFKCRQKRKAWMQELETKSDEVTKRNKALHLLVNQLKEEAIQLKNQMVSIMTSVF